MKSVETVVVAGMVCLLVLFTGFSTGYGAVHYVALSGSHTTPYTNWAMAATNIQDAIDVAVSGETVMVSNGTYYISTQISITNGISLVSMNTPQQTVIDASNNCRCVMMDHTNAFLSGFTLTNGYGSYAGGGRGGGGVFLANGIVSNCIISGNSAYCWGGGVSSQSGLIIGCLIVGNEASQEADGNANAWGGGVYANELGGCYINNCIIQGNRCRGIGNSYWLYIDLLIEGCGGAHGGGAFNGILKDSMLCNNYAYSYGGVGMYDGGQSHCWGGAVEQSTLSNCVVFANEAHAATDVGFYQGAFGGGAYNSKLVNCTVAMNISRGSAAGGGLSCCEAVNTIVWSNVAVGNLTSQFEGTGTYCCVYPALEGEGNITNDPMFANMQAGDLHLCGLSPCIDAGTNQAWMTNSVDIDGNSRIYNGTVDMGAYETLVTVCGVTFSGSVFSTDWYCESGSVCRLEYATEYPPTNWQHAGGSHTANQAEISLQDTNAPTAGRYYRVWWDQP